MQAPPLDFERYPREQIIDAYRQRDFEWLSLAIAANLVRATWHAPSCASCHAKWQDDIECPRLKRLIAEYIDLIPGLDDGGPLGALPDLQLKWPDGSSYRLRVSSLFN
jgi:hypothetical protein